MSGAPPVVLFGEAKGSLLYGVAMNRTLEVFLGDPLNVFYQKSMIRVMYSSRFGSKVLIFGE